MHPIVASGHPPIGAADDTFRARQALIRTRGTLVVPVALTPWGTRAAPDAILAFTRTGESGAKGRAARKFLLGSRQRAYSRGCAAYAFRGH
jgi:hypothetical protein